MFTIYFHFFHFFLCNRDWFYSRNARILYRYKLRNDHHLQSQQAYHVDVKKIHINRSWMSRRIATKIKSRRLKIAQSDYFKSKFKISFWIVISAFCTSQSKITLHDRLLFTNRRNLRKNESNFENCITFSYANV